MHKVRILISAMMVVPLILILAGCSETVQNGLMPPRGIKLYLQAPHTTQQDSSFHVSLHAVVETVVYSITRPDFPDPDPATPVDTLDTLFIHLTQVRTSSDDSIGFVFDNDSGRTITPVHSGDVLDFTFDLTAVGTGQWTIVAEAFFLDSVWLMPPGMEEYTDHKYRRVWSVSKKVNIE